MLQVSNNVIVVKIFGAPASALRVIPEISAYSATDSIITMSLTPNFDVFKRKALKDVKRQNKIPELTLLNLVFDDSNDAEETQPASQIGRE
jgi:hypothetical protein